MRAHANCLAGCNYAGTPTLCFDDGTALPQGGHSQGVNRFLSRDYRDVDTRVYGAAGGLVAPDNHEVNTPDADGGFVLETVFQPRQVDLTAWEGGKEGWVWDGCFQSIGIPDGAVRFEWCAMEKGVGINETATYMWGSALGASNPIAGDGSQGDPWDWFHVNSVDWDGGSGDYLVSARHANAVYRVCGTASQSKECAGKQGGDVAWRLGGKKNDFKMDFAFSAQHMGRFHAGEGGNTTVSLFNDGSDGVTATAKSSAGYVVNIAVTGAAPNLMYEATLVKNFTLPAEYSILSESQGSTQLLPNGNMVIGWGSAPFYSEFDNDGELLYHAEFGNGVQNMMNYRAVKYEWTGEPMSRPDLVSYASSCTSTLYGYASWNGATEVVRWRFRGTNDTSSPNGWRVLANVKKSGFETMSFLSGSVNGSARYVVADAIGATGRVLGVSNVTQTFVPSQQMTSQNNCTALACEAGTDYVVMKSANVAGQC